MLNAWKPCMQNKKKAKNIRISVRAIKDQKERERKGQKKHTVTGPPREREKGKRRFIYILLTHSNSLDPNIIPWGTPPHFPTLNPHMVLPRALSGQSRRCTKQEKYAITDSVIILLNVHTHTPTRKENQQDVFCSLSKCVWHSSALPANTCVLILEEQHSGITFHWHQKPAKIAACDGHSWCIQWDKDTFTM